MRLVGNGRATLWKGVVNDLRLTSGDNPERLSTGAEVNPSVAIALPRTIELSSANEISEFSLVHLGGGQG